MPSGAGPVGVARRLPNAAGQRADKVLAQKVGDTWQPSLPGNRQPSLAESEEVKTAEEQSRETEVSGTAEGLGDHDEPWEDEMEEHNVAEEQDDSYELLAENAGEQDISTLENDALEGEKDNELQVDEADAAEAHSKPEQEGGAPGGDEGNEVEEPYKGSSEKPPEEADTHAKNEESPVSGLEAEQVEADEEEVDEDEYGDEYAEEAEEEDAEEAWFEGEEEEEEAEDGLEGDEDDEEQNAENAGNAVEDMEGDEKDEEEASGGVQKAPHKAGERLASQEGMDQWPNLSDVVKGKGKGVSTKQDSASSTSKAELQKQVTKLLEENHILKLELGQSRFQIKTLSDLRGKADMALREAAAAKAVEARSRREVEQARDYATKRIEFVRNEKAEMLLRAQTLERELSKALEQDSNLKQELKEANWERDHAAERLDTVQREADHWKKECGKQSAQCKQLEARVRQLEQTQAKQKDACAANGGCGTENMSVHRVGSPSKPSGTGQPSGGAAPRQTGSARRSGSAASSNGTTKNRPDADLALLDASRISFLRRFVWRLMLAISTVYSSVAKLLGREKDARTREVSSARSSRGRHAVAASAAGDQDGEDGSRQQFILLSLVGLIACLMVFKVCTWRALF